MKLVNNAKSWHKMWSVRIFALIWFIQVIEQNWGYFSYIVPVQYHNYVMAGFGLAGIVARLIQQPNINNDCKQD